MKIKSEQYNIRPKYAEIYKERHSRTFKEYIFKKHNGGLFNHAGRKWSGKGHSSDRPPQYSPMLNIEER